MANRLPTHTSSGRALKPSRRLREKLRDQIEKEYDDLKLELDRTSRHLRVLIGDRRGEQEIRRNYEEWLETYDELGITANELRRYLNPDEIPYHDKNLGESTMGYEYLRKLTEEYLAYLTQEQEPPITMSAVDHKVDSEAKILQKRIQEIEEEINNTTELLQKNSLHGRRKKETRPSESKSKPFSSTPKDIKTEYSTALYEEEEEEEFEFDRRTSYAREPEDPLLYRSGHYPQLAAGASGYDPGYRNRFVEDSIRASDNEKKERRFPRYEDYYTKSDFQPKPDLSWIHMGNDDKAEPRKRTLAKKDDKRGAKTSDPTVDVLQKLADILQNKKENRLPSMEPEKFEGDIMKFPAWMSSYETLIEKRFESASEKMFYLQKYTAGEAKELISGFEDFDTEDAYLNAKMMLMTRYGDKIKIAESYRNKLSAWPNLKPSDRVGLQKFSDFLWKCYKAMSTIGYLSSLDAPEENKKLVSKLPFYIADRWNRVIDRWVYDKPADYGRGFMVQSRPYPPFAEFCKFLASEARVANGPCSSIEMKSASGGEDSRSGNKKSAKKTSLAVNVNQDDSKTNSPDKEKPSNSQRDDKKKPNVSAPKKGDPDYVPTPFCAYCKEQHWLSECKSFIGEPFETKKTFLMEKGICFGCFRRGHTFKTCRIRRPELMRSQEPISDKDRKSGNEVVNMSTIAEVAGKRSSTIIPLWVSKEDEPDKEVLIYAAIDSQSNSCFITPELTEQLSAPSEDVCIRLTTMGAAREVKTKKVQGLRVRGVNEENRIKLPTCYQEDEIPADRDTIPDPEMVAQWRHLRSMSGNLMKPNDNIGIGMLIGYNCSTAFIQVERIFGDIYEPFAMKTPMGWSVMGRLSGEGVGDDEDRLCFTTSTREITSAGIKKIFDLGFEAVNSDVKVSQNDRKFVEIAEKSIVQRDDGHLQLDLPLKDDKIMLPDNRRVAEKRLQGLKRKMKNDEEYSERYQKFINDMIDKGQAEWVDEDAEDTEEGLVWYLPHMGVYHPRKPGKLRVVFDASARYLHSSLNECLLSGPDMTNNLVGVLLRFRSERIAVTCDVEGMFHQVFVSPKFRNLLRFLWFEDDNPEGEIKVGRVLVHLFGASSSPGCANYALKEVARIYGEEYGELTAEFLKRFFYVDDGIISLRTEEEAVDLIFSSHSLCRRGGFWLHKYSSNSRAVLEKIPTFLRAVELKDWEPKYDNLPIETTLGVKWCRETDCFIFVVQILDKPETRRGMLSALSSIYDPLGLIAPVLLRGRILLKKLCAMKFDWDDLLPEEDRRTWSAWYRQLKQLEDLKIPRCVKEKVRSEKTVQLHLFSDASVEGYGVCAYLRLSEEEEDNIDTSLIFAKARVSPSKYVTVPRLELQAALLSVKVGRFLRDELQYQEVETTYWTDSKVTLGYISNATKRFHVYVSNRVTTIREMSTPEQWRYIPTGENPADIASRGLGPAELIESEIWWKGPDVVREKIIPEPDEETFDVSDEDPEVKTEKISLGVQAKEDEWTSPLSRLSTWRRTLKVTALCRRYITLLRMKTSQRSQHTITRKPLTVEEIKEAEVILLKNLQRNSFGEIYDVTRKIKEYPTSREAIIRRNVLFKKNTNLYKLDVYMGEDDLIRVGGRLKRSGFSIALVHPILLPKQHGMVEKLIRHYHDRNAHVGRGSTLMAIRAAGFWIIQGRSTVERAIRTCVICKKLRGRLMGQRMADLPRSRLEPTPPFIKTGVDVFGPFEIKQARSMRKRWICIFVDMVMRAVHVEVLFMMDVSSFMNAFRRLIGRRGVVQELYCDRGSNFIGTDNEMKKAVDELNLEELKIKLVEEDCNLVHFNFNFPKSSHMGGSWERLIRSYRSVFSRLLAQHASHLDDESLLTLSIETEAILNSRPLTYVSMNDTNDPLPLTPMQLLTMKGRIVLPPPGKFVREDLYCAKRWRRVQYLSNQFWTQWLKDYVPTLHERKKWNEKRENLQKEDIVLVYDENEKRNKWPMARVMDVVTGADSLVRKAVVKTAAGVYDRPIHKLVFLMRPRLADNID